MRIKIKNEKGITLISLVITLAVIVILSFSISVNMDGLTQQSQKSKLDSDLTQIEEKIGQYYSKNKELPIINKYTATSNFETSKNVNDGEDYYVIDLGKIGNLELNYGKDYEVIKNTNIDNDVTQISDVFIINQTSQTVYYAKGITYNGKDVFRLMVNYSQID